MKSCDNIALFGQRLDFQFVRISVSGEQNNHFHDSCRNLGGYIRHFEHEIFKMPKHYLGVASYLSEIPYRWNFFNRLCAVELVPIKPQWNCQYSHDYCTMHVQQRNTMYKHVHHWPESKAYNACMFCYELITLRRIHSLGCRTSLPTVLAKRKQECTKTTPGDDVTDMYGM